MGRVFREHLSVEKVYKCAKCKAHLAKAEDIVSNVRSPGAPFAGSSNVCCFVDSNSMVVTAGRTCLAQRMYMLVVDESGWGG